MRKKNKCPITYFFVDESGDPYFYDRFGNFIVGKEGCSKILILGFVKTEHPEILRKAILTFENRYKIKVDSEIEIFAQTSQGEPCLQIADYMNWAIYRAFTKREMRYYNFVKNKISLIVDIYDFTKYPKNYYHKRNPFDVNKISPL
jgi:hypothetical protein